MQWFNLSVAKKFAMTSHSQKILSYLELEMAYLKYVKGLCHWMMTASKPCPATSAANSNEIEKSSKVPK